ncbi:Coatomer subunit gamma-2 [Holothuria leucospilota]|uniref:Coatomer subunit gamma-2 n=1 Tax=Holothuria leucospilota TaxID=206669 RepID=A0A9Q1B9E3_HOLLE|nr:Coatomer subunit gamma-2 [Holothuria leucospilota]
MVLLERSLLDSDDEVRDRATFYLNILKQNQKALNSAYILNGLAVSVVGLERALHHYTIEPSEQPFDIKTVPLDTQPFAEHKVTSDVSPAARPTEKAAPPTQEIYAEQLAAVPEFAHIGPLFKSSKPVELTESETEYIVRCIKHTFPKHVVFQFDCTNTLNDQQLEEVYVQMESAEGLEVETVVPAPILKYNQPGTTYTLVQLPDDNTEVASVFSNTLKYSVKDCDPNTGEPDEEGYEDEYVLEDIELTFADHVQRVMKPNFMASWEEIGEDNELEETFALSTKTLEEAIQNIVNFLGMQPCERSDKVPEGKSSHSLFLAGVFRGGVDVLVKARLALQDTVKMQITVRSTDPEISELITSAVG